MNIIKTFTEIFVLIRKNKLLVFFLCLLQAIFILSFLGAVFYYSTPILESTTNILSYIEQIQTTEESIRESFLLGENVLGDDPLLIHENYKAILTSLGKLGIAVFLLIAVIESNLWYISNLMARKIKLNAKSYWSYILKFLLSKILFLLISIVIFFLSAKLFVSQFLQEQPFSPLLLIIGLLIVSYFLLVSLAVLHRLSIKDLFSLKKLFLFGIKKAPWLLLTFLVAFLLVAVPLSILPFLASINLFFLLVSFALLVSGFVLARLLIVVAVSKIG